MKRIADARINIQSIEDAAAVMEHIATIACEVAAEEARAEKKIVAIKSDLTARTAAAREDLQSLEQQLSEFILANKPLFQKPRRHKTNFGEFGLQTSTELTITNDDLLREHLMTQGYHDCMKVVRSILKGKVVERIDAGEDMPGAQIRTGDTAVYKVSKALLAEAKGEAA